MNDETAIRRSNLQRLCKSRQWGPAELHEHAGRRYSFWFTLLKGQKSFGEKLARSIEEQLSLPRGWLDEYDDPPAELEARDQQSGINERWLFSRELHEACNQLDVAQRAHLENVMRAVLGLKPLRNRTSRRTTP